MCKLVGYLFKTAGVLFLLPAILSVGASVRSDLKAIISSKVVTNWGDWGPMEYCPPGTFAHAAQLKFERPNIFNLGDDTALNGIALFCGNYHDTSTTEITSTVGPWGDWFPRTRICFHALIGFSLKAEEYRENGDDTAATNINFVCPFVTANGVAGYDEVYTEGLAWAWGKWGEWKVCPLGSGICGIQTQVESVQGDGDDTSLNNVRLACCKFESKYYKRKTTG